MKLKSLLLTTLLVAAPCAINAQDAKKADLKEVTAHLDMDGEFFMANNIEGDLGKLAALGSDYVATARANGKTCIPEGLDFTAIMQDMGLDDLVAYGRSAKHHGDHWVSKMYLQNGGSKKGIFSMMGENDVYEVIHFAPSGSDMVAEWNIDTKQLMSSIQNVPRCEKMEKFMGRHLPLGGTVEDMIKKFTAKVSLAVKLDDEIREVCPYHEEYTFPRLHGCVRMEGANQIWDQVGNLAGFVMKVEKQEDGTLLLTPHKQKKGMNAVMLMDQKNDTLWAATSPEFLTECRGEGAKLVNDESFKLISDGVKSGNGLVYISQQACLEIRQVKEAKIAKKDKKKLSSEMMKKVMDHLTESKNGYFIETHQSDKGVNVVLKAPCPLKEMMCGKRCGKKKGCFSCGKGCDKDKGQCGCADKKVNCECESDCKCS